MPIILLTDSDGDDVAIEASQIVAVTVGRMQRPRDTSREGPASGALVTLLHTSAGPLIVSQSLEAVVTAWRAASDLAQTPSGRRGFDPAPADALILARQTLAAQARASARARKSAGATPAEAS